MYRPWIIACNLNSTKKSFIHFDWRISMSYMIIYMKWIKISFHASRTSEFFSLFENGTTKYTNIYLKYHFIIVIVIILSILRKQNAEAHLFHITSQLLLLTEKNETENDGESTKKNEINLPSLNAKYKEEQKIETVFWQSFRALKKKYKQTSDKCDYNDFISAKESVINHLNILKLWYLL